MSYMDEDIIKVKDNSDENGFFIDDFKDINFENENEVVENYGLLNFGSVYQDNERTIVIEEIKEAVKEVIEEEIVQQLNIDKINYLVDVLEGNIGLIKQKIDVSNGKAKPAKKNVADIEIEIDYVDGMSCKQIAEKYAFTEDGIRKRLKRIGVYKSSRN